MFEPKPQLSRRRTDGDGNDALRIAQRVIAEYAFQLYVDGGCDRGRVDEYWRLAEQAWLESDVEREMRSASST